MPDSKSVRPKRAGGRPTIVHVRNQFIAVRVTTIEKLRFLEKAKRSGVDPTEYARSRILRGIVRAKQSAANANAHASEPLSITTQVLWHELRRIGVNLNQIAHHCNALHVPPPAEFHLLVRELLALLQRLTSS